jgi:LysM repeat protein
VKRILFFPATLIMMAACGSPPPPAAAPEPEPEVEEELVDEPAAPPAPPPSVLIQERIREPFGVQSSGRPAPRQDRSDVVVTTRTAGGAGRTAASGENSAALDTAAPAAPDAAAAPDPEPDTAVPPAREVAGARPGADRPAPAPPARPAAPAAPAAPTAPAGRAPGQRTHTVQRGETFYAVARRYGVTPMALAAANPGLDINRIQAGQLLRLPAAEPARPAPAQQRRTHTVQAGETLWSISRRYGVTPAEVRTANRMTDDTVRLGQTLVIPTPSAR